MATNGSFSHQEQHKVPSDAYAAAPALDTSASAAGNNNLSKDEVGWYFVEQYYTTLSKSPEKLHLFYGKRSQFVYGKEAEVANVSVGRQAIQERIKQLDFQDCKVRVSNVDSQASFDNIVIQVIGETSNKAGEPNKFVQTFVLAQQPSGYFVLNDMLRYVDEDTDDATAPETTAAVSIDAPVQSVATPAEPVAEPAAKQEPAQDIEKAKALPVEEQSIIVPAVAKQSAPLNGGEAEASEEVEPNTHDAPVSDIADTTAAELLEEDVKEPEKPKDPEPSPVAKASAPSEPAAPPKPMTWASRAAAAAGPRPAVPLPKTATPPTPNQNRAPAPASASTTAAASAPASAATPAAVAAATAATATTGATPTPSTEVPAKEASGWQTAGADSKRQNKPQSISGNIVEKEGTMGYVKYVTEKVQDADLRTALAAHGELSYFDINRQKNCAFVEYKTLEGYQAAISSNPHTVNGENIIVEPRRPKAAAYGSGNFNANRGGSGGRGRGNFSGQNRGRGGAARGRGGTPANNA